MSNTEYYTFLLHSGGAWNIARKGVVVSEWADRKDAKRVSDLLNRETAVLRAELDNVRKERDEAYERAARICQDHAIAGGQYCAALIRALKEKP